MKKRNWNIPQSLREGLAAGKVVPFIGAGVSKSVRRKGTGTPLFPSWSDLLHALADRMKEEGKEKECNAVRSLLEVGDPEDYLDVAVEHKSTWGPTFGTNSKNGSTSRKPRPKSQI